ncbi:nitroreductase family protein [Acinetobacter baumannii]|uniref:nitroreductase family protein n=1 Tax=Acinetobacter baumannii TaxID=470 RepID=UPI00234269B7|nr:nitroreductase family protein [Acinetobacter baumannii]MDC4919650.1 nitroreductase family protein [Acinetobacter baumannii]MDC4934120.1 nitroreductase family protein [Acinetobacter baumannii]MDC5521376.1 nitroreductase family protein [Acinetobacter baumannii]
MIENEELPDNIVSTRMSAMQFMQNEELLESIPNKPKLIPELLYVPISHTSLVIYGATVPRTLHCIQGVKLLQRLLSEIDGTKTIKDLELIIVNQIDGGAIGLISLLFRYGLLEDGESKFYSVSEVDSNISSWVGRFAGNTRIHRNREAVIGEAKKIKLLIVAPKILIPSIERGVRGIPFGDVFVVAIEDYSSIQMNVNHAIFIDYITEEFNRLNKIMDHWLNKGLPYFYTRIDKESVQLGPFIIPGYSANHNCLYYQVKRNLDQDDHIEAACNINYALYEYTNFLLGLSLESYINTVHINFTDDSGKFTEVLPIARIWGTDWESEDLSSFSENSYLCWLHHVSTRPPPSNYISPIVFQTHFSLKNIKLYEESAKPFNLSDTKIYRNLNTDVDNLGKNHKQSVIDQLKEILYFTNGRKTQIDGTKKRIAPSAGGLQSVSIYLLINDLDFIEPGVYFFNPDNSQLELDNNVDYKKIKKFVYGQAELFNINYPHATVLLTSDIARLQRKYTDFGLNLAYLDAGVASSYLFLYAAIMKWHCSEYEGVNLYNLTNCLFSTDQELSNIVTVVFNLAPPNSYHDITVNPLSKFQSHTSELLIKKNIYWGGNYSPGIKKGIERWQENLLSKFTSHSKKYLNEIILKRKATYDFSSTKIVDIIFAEKIIGLVFSEYKRVNTIKAKNIYWEPWIILADNEKKGLFKIYACHGENRSEWELKGEINRTQLNKCINQSSFSKAGFYILIVARLDIILAEHGSSGYFEVHRHAGSAVTYAWLAAVDLGLIGAPCGRFVEHGLKDIGIDGYKYSVMFSLVLGYQENNTSVTYIY